jgi:cysteine desulfuration protein SufE
MDSTIPQPLLDIIDQFRWCEGQEKVELLIQFAEKLPPLPERLADDRAKMDQVAECMTPVFVQAEADAGKMVFHFDVPAESPTVRGFAAMMKEGLDGSTPEEILQVPGDFFQEMGLQQVLSFQRLNGLAALLAHMKRLAVKEVERG